MEKKRKTTTECSFFPSWFSPILTHRLGFCQFFFVQSEAVYDATLQSVKQSFPQYVRELEGVAHGAGVEFHKVKYI